MCTIISFYRRIDELHRPQSRDSFLEGGVPASNKEYFWDKREQSSCFHLDDICHGDDRWFYRHSERTTSHQPTITYVAGNVTLSHGYIDVDNRFYFNVSTDSKFATADDRCRVSPTPFHMVVQSAFNDMMGEFYSRTMLGINQWMRDYPTKRSDIQMYMHIVEEGKQRVFEGHRLFLGGLPNNNKFDNFLSLIEDQSQRCQCFQKLVFCGYDLLNAPIDTIPSSGVSNGRDDTTAKIFSPIGHIKNDKIGCSKRSDGEFLRTGKCFAYRKLRRDLFETYSKKDPNLGAKIFKHRRDILVQKRLVDDDVSNEEVGNWKFVGLTERKYRRKWLNIDEAISFCDQNFIKQRIVCTKVDVEEATSPEEQLLLHRSLHGLVGIHGASLTQVSSLFHRDRSMNSSLRNALLIRLLAT